MRYTFQKLRQLAITGLLACAFALCFACASGDVPQTVGAADTEDVVLWRPCPAQFFDCDWTGSYAHVRSQHCENSCQDDNESQYRVGFIDTCNDNRLAEVCSTTVQSETCQYYVDLAGRYVAQARLTVVVGTDRNDYCKDTKFSTVVFDKQRKVVTMYPGK